RRGPLAELCVRNPALAPSCGRKRAIAVRSTILEGLFRARSAGARWQADCPPLDRSAGASRPARYEPEAIMDSKSLHPTADTSVSGTLRTATRHAVRTLALAALVAAGSSAGRADAAPPEAAPIWRTQLRVRTCASTNAGTNNPVFASLAPGNLTALDYGRNDFPVNNTFTYDLVPTGISTFADVTRLRVSKTGTDGLCIRSLELLLNNRSIFLRDFGAAGQFLDGGGGSVNVTFTGAQLRANQRWIDYQLPFPALTLTRAELESRVEAMAGTAMSGSPAKWGHLKGTRFVEATRVNASTLHFDLDAFVDTLDAMGAIPGFDLLAEVLDFFSVAPPNPDVDIDFNLQITCDDGVLSFQVANASVNVDTIPRISLPAIP